MRRLGLFLPLLALLAAPVHAADRKESAYDRVIRTQTIRCGYTPYSVGLARDPNTGKLYGIYKDIVEDIGAKLGLKIEWTEEVGWGQQIEGLNAGRYDMVCSPANITGPRARAADMTTPLYYSPVWAWVRANDTRFDNKGRSALNDPGVKISVMDGEQSEAQARYYFPKAAQVSLPQGSDFSNLMMNVANGKADVALIEPLTAHEFMEKNPGALRQIKGDRPLLMAANIMLIRADEPAFKAMINNILTDLFLSGQIDAAIDRYERYPNSYVRSKGYN